MARNFYFSEKVRSEINLYESLVIEALKIYGQDVYYLPRNIVNENVLFGEDPASQFASSHKIEMYIENTEGFNGEGDLFTRFGVEIRDEATFIVSKSRWSTQVQRADNALQGDRPTEGDLIYLPLTKSMFEINHVEHEQPFYQIENVPVYKMRCTLFEYSGEDFDTRVDDIQSIEQDYSYQYKVCVDAPASAEAIVTANPNYIANGYVYPLYVESGGDVLSIALVSGGTYYTYPPAIRFIGGNPVDSAIATAIIDSALGTVIGIQLIDSGNGYQSSPTIQFVGGSAVDSDYRIGDTVSQTFSSGVTITGEIQGIILDSAGDSSRPALSSRCYMLAHVGADDGKYHTFIADSNARLLNVTRNSVGGLKINLVEELNKISNSEQNETFSDFSDDFLDFSEDNPFGDPEAQ